MEYLPGHLKNLATWIDLAEQVVVVDSFSTDGTVEFLKTNLHHPNILFVNHPPGLFASWNYGINRIASEFCYISTVGDSITRAGLEHFAGTVSQLDCDVLVSRPNFVDEAGQPCVGPEWPMDFIIARLDLRVPALLAPAVVLTTAFLHTGGAILGSCASDIFRMVVLKKYPFPLDFGTAGDGAWSLQNAGRINWAATPEKVTTFRIHPPTASADEVESGKNFGQMAAHAASEWLKSNSANVSSETHESISRLMVLSTEYQESCRRYTSLRKGKWPWILNPSAWIARSQREQLKARVNSLTQMFYRRSL